VDVDYAHELVTRSSIMITFLKLNNTPIRWVSKRQKTVQTSNHGSGLVTSGTATEVIFEVRFILRSLGVDLDGQILK
jgi:hypothetical protein